MMITFDRSMPNLKLNVFLCKMIPNNIPNIYQKYIKIYTKQTRGNKQKSTYPNISKVYKINPKYQGRPGPAQARGRARAGPGPRARLRAGLCAAPGLGRGRAGLAIQYLSCISCVTWMYLDIYIYIHIYIYIYVWIYFGFFLVYVQYVLGIFLKYFWYIW